MMTFIIIYLVGCVLSYMRLVASFYEIEEDYIKYIPCSQPKYGKKYIWYLSLLSWVTFMAGICIFFTDSEKYFFKTSFKKLLN